MELEKGAELARQAEYIREILAHVRAPLTGYALQDGCSAGLYADGWAAPHVQFTVRPLQPVAGLAIRGWRPDAAPGELTLTIDGKRAGSAALNGGSFTLDAAIDPILDRAFTIAIDCMPSFQARGDDRSLAFVLTEVRANH